MSNQLASNDPELKKSARQILRETFKHSVDIFESLTLNQFSKWFQQLHPLKTKEKGDIEDQILVLTILSSLCVYQ
jgi:hypothetical protein